MEGYCPLCHEIMPVEHYIAVSPLRVCRTCGIAFDPDISVVQVDKFALSARYGLRVARWLAEKMQEEVERIGADCDDNHRFAQKGNRDEEAAFAETRERGCCGSHEFSITYGMVEFLAGFNYGH